MSKPFFPFLLGGLFWIVLVPMAHAETVSERLFFSPDQRTLIDRERAAYLKGEVFTPKASPTKTVGKAVKKGPVLPKRISVTSMIVLPNGEKTVRINGRYHHFPTKTTLDAAASSAEMAVLKVNQKPVYLPVGMTYLPYADKQVKNYLYPRRNGSQTGTKRAAGDLSLTPSKDHLTKELNKLHVLSNQEKK